MMIQRTRTACQSRSMSLVGSQGSPSPTAMSRGGLCSAATAAQMATDTSVRHGPKRSVGTPHVCRRLLGMCVVRFLLLNVMQTAAIHPIPRVIIVWHDAPTSKQDSQWPRDRKVERRKQQQNGDDSFSHRPAIRTTCACYRQSLGHVFGPTDPFAVWKPQCCSLRLNHQARGVVTHGNSEMQTSRGRHSWHSFIVSASTHHQSRKERYLDFDGCRGSNDFGLAF